MTFPKGYRGVKKIFSAEILEIIAIAVVVVSSLAAAFLVGDAQPVTGDPTGSIGLVFFALSFVSVVIQVVSYIIRLVGLKQAGSDEPRFNVAFVFALIALGIYIAISVTSTLSIEGEIINMLLGILRAVSHIIIMVYTISGIRSFAGRLGRDDLVSLGGKLLALLVVMYLITAITYVIPAFLGDGKTISTIEEILSVIASVLSFINGIIFIIYLGKAKNMLKNS